MKLRPRDHQGYQQRRASTQVLANSSVKIDCKINDTTWCNISKGPSNCFLHKDRLWFTLLRGAAPPLLRPLPVVTPPLPAVNNHPAQSCGYRINVNWSSSRECQLELSSCSYISSDTVDTVQISAVLVHEEATIAWQKLSEMLV